MINQKDVIEFFDRYAGDWDSELVRSDEIIALILDNAGVKADSRVLDVACGTGVLIGDYLKRDVESVTGIDISGEMIKIARSKFPQENVRFVCGDVETAELEGGYDAVIVYNAFPHFPQPERLIARLSALLRSGGILTVAHGASRESIDAHHSGASKVSLSLPEAEALSEIFAKYLEPTTVLSTDSMYQVAGKKV